jgi:long-chain fatty acid transport protein
MKTKLTLLLISISQMLPCISRIQAAETLSLIPDSAQSLAEAGGRFANLDDATAVRVNPANFADAERPLLQFNTGLWHADIQFSSNAGGRLEEQKPWVIPANLYAIFPIIPGRLSWGVGVTTPYGLGTTYSQKSPPFLRYTVPYESSLQTVSITPAISWRINDSISAGIGLDVMYGRLQINQLVPLPGPSEGEFRFDGDGWGLSGYGGITWNITPNQRLALVGRLPLRLEMNGSFEAQGVPAGLPAGSANRSSFETDMTFPGSIALGYGIDLTDRLTLGFDFKWSANSSHDDIPLNTSNSNNLLPTRSQPLQWKNSIDLGFGTSYKLNEAWKIRGGYLFSENSMPDSTYTPSIPAYDRHIFSLGIGWLGKSNRVDLTYGYIFNPTRTTTHANNPAFNGRYKQQWHVVMLSVGHYF